MVLLDLLRAIEASVTVIHVNYQLRGTESDADEEMVREVCESLGIEVLVRKVDLKSELSNGGNLQNRAREIRYEWFAEILADNQNNRVLLAHHEDDQIETFFQHLGRKSGIMGMSCMKLEHDGIVRPLLHFSKSDVLIYAQKNKLKWREDASNASNAYSRNRLRNEFLPFVYSKIPNLRDAVLEIIEHFQATQTELELTIAPILVGIHKHGKLLQSEFQALSEVEQVELLRSLNLSATYLPRLQGLHERGKRIPITHPIYTAMVCDTAHFTFLKKHSTLVEIEIEHVDFLPETLDKSCVYLDEDKLVGKLKVRKWQLGDRISPIGMKGSQLISDVIKDAKIDSDSKQAVAVLHDDQQIHWCIALKIGRMALATPESKHILRCSITDSAGEE